MKLVVIGIDPGVRGAMCVLATKDDPVQVWRLEDLPLLDGGDARDILCAAVLIERLQDIAETRGLRVVAYMEKVGPMPSDSRIGAFSFGRAVGVIETALAAAGLPATLVAPGVWKRVHGLIKTDKAASARRCIELYPSVADEVRRRKDHNRAEAVLIAHYGLRQEGVFA